MRKTKQAIRAREPHPPLRFIAILLTCLSALLSSASAAPASPTPLPFGTDLQGKPLPQLAPPGTRVVVMYFAATDCPISNRYLPDIAHLNNAYKNRAVQVLAVYPNPADNRAVVEEHQKQYGPAGETVLDPQQSLVRLAHARLTPEAAVLVPDGAHWREVYLGRIDDRYLSLGQERPAATRHDLEAAVRAALAHQPIPSPGGPAVGCSIVPLS